MKRIMGTETEYGIVGGHADQVINAYHGKGKEHTNLGETNNSAVEGMHDVGGHIGGDYGTVSKQLEIHNVNVHPGLINSHPHSGINSPASSEFSARG